MGLYLSLFLSFISLWAQPSVAQTKPEQALMDTLSGLSSSLEPYSASPSPELSTRFILDQNLDDIEVLNLNEDLAFLNQIKLKDLSKVRADKSIETPFIQRAYQKLFGSKLIEYFTQRIKVIIASKNTDYGGAPSPLLVASNLSFMEWINPLIRSLMDQHVSGKSVESLPKIEFQNHTLPNTDLRVGFIKLSLNYAMSTHPLFRVSTLIHEARHSDCPQGLTMTQINQIVGKLKQEEQPGIDEYGNCGFDHLSCPVDHAYSGLKACDSFVFGSYGVEVLFYQNLLKRKKNMSELERQILEYSIAESESRLIHLNGMMNGQHGLPSATHKGLVQDGVSFVF